MNKKELGKLGEQMAADYLTGKGYLILKRNYTTRDGEIDLIAARGNELHFVEVKTRRGELYGTPAEGVTGLKKRHMRAAASSFLAMTKGMPGSGRVPQFDVIEIQINHIEDV